MYQFVIVVHIIVAFAIIGLVLLQQGRGADAGAGFGGGASGTLFGARGTATFLSKATAIMAAIFFSTSILLAYLSSRPDNKKADILESPVTQPGGQPADVPQLESKQPKPSAPKGDVPETPAVPAPAK